MNLSEMDNHTLAITALQVIAKGVDDPASVAEGILLAIETRVQMGGVLAALRMDEEAGTITADGRAEMGEIIETLSRPSVWRETPPTADDKGDWWLLSSSGDLSLGKVAVDKRGRVILADGTGWPYTPCELKRNSLWAPVTLPKESA